MVRLQRDHARRVRRVAHFMRLQGTGELVMAFMFVVVWLLTLRMEVRGELGQFGVVAAPIFALTAALSGVLKLAASRRNAAFQGYGLGLVALLSAPLSLCSVYCAPTALALAVYGCWVYAHEDVRTAFDMKAKGRTDEEIEAFLRGDPAPGPPNG